MSKKPLPSVTQQTKDYFAAQPPLARKALKEIQGAIGAAAPGAEAAFSYRIPAFRFEGRPLVWYAGFTRHVSLYPIGTAIRTALAPQLRGYETSKGTVRFPLDRPIPVALIRRLVKARIAEMRAANQESD
ncbi:MAG: DUF1801 domain-containing protein [Vicinamibacterales bacterium]